MAFATTKIMKVPHAGFRTGFARNAGESANPHLWKSLVGYWCPQVGQTYQTLWDYGPHGMHGQMISGSTPVWVPSPTGWAIQVNEDGWTVADNQLLALGTANFTIHACALSTSNGPNNANLFSKDKGNQESPGGQEAWAIQKDSTAEIIRFKTAGTELGITTIESMNDSVWHSYFVLRDGDEGRFYLDAVNNATDATFHNGISYSNDQNLNFCCSDDIRTTREWIGTVGPFGIWTRALLDVEIRQLHNDPLALLRLRRRVHIGGVVEAGGANAMPMAMHYYRTRRSG